MTRKVVAIVLALGLSTPAFAGGIRESGAQAVQRAAGQQPPAQRSADMKVPRSYLWPGAIAFIAGMAIASYGFLHTTDGDYVEPSDASKLSNTKLGIGGLALAASGGAVMLIGARQGGVSSQRIDNGPSVGIGKRVSW
jgi:hypothetical protein